MPIHLKRNPYLGVNAHANSWLLNKSGQWHSFHQEFIVRLTETVNAKLPSGFEARAETPVQIQEIRTDKNGESKLGRLFRPVPDTSVFQIGKAPRESHLTPGQTPTLVVAPIETLDMAETPKTPSTVNVYEVITDEELGRLVARIELLSPTNKPPETAEKCPVNGR